MKRHNRLIKRDPDERFLEYADKRIRYVLVVLKLENRKPVEILRIQYSYFAFDSQGHLREDVREKKARLPMDMIKPMQSDQEPNHVDDAGYKFAKKRFDSEYRWKPSPELESAIFSAIFG